MPRLRKGCGRGNTSALMLRRVFKAGARTRKDGNELVRSCKNECRRGGRGESGWKWKQNWEWATHPVGFVCQQKGFLGYPALQPSLVLLFPRWSWVRGWAAAWGGKSARLKRSFWLCTKPSWQPSQVTPPSTSVVKTALQNVNGYKVPYWNCNIGVTTSITLSK